MAGSASARAIQSRVGRLPYRSTYAASQRRPAIPAAIPSRTPANRTWAPITSAAYEREIAGRGCGAELARGFEPALCSLLCLCEPDETLILVSQEGGIGHQPLELRGAGLSQLQRPLDLAPGRQDLFSFPCVRHATPSRRHPPPARQSYASPQFSNGRTPRVRRARGVPVGFLRETAAVLARIGERINEDAQKAG